MWTEPERLAALHAYGILDTDPERAFDDLVVLTGQLLSAPIVAVNLIDAHRQWFKAEIGLGTREMPLDDSICKFVLLEQQRMVITDTRDDPRFSCNPLVTGAPGLRFYAGELLKSPEGLPLGTLCVLDTTPRPQGLTDLQESALRTLAQQVQTQLELRKIVREQDKLLLEQQRMHVELQEGRERFERIVSQAATGVVQVDPDGQIRVVNDKFCAMLGYDRAELLALTVRDITAPESMAVTREALDKVGAGDAGVVVQKQYRRRDGSLMWASSSVSAVRSPVQQFEGIVAIVVDISKDREVEESLRKLASDLSEADQRKSEFLATLAHELRNPLAPISTGLAMLKLGGDSAAAVGKIRAMMERQVAQMVRLIDDLLDVARISGGKIDLQKSVVDIRTVLAAAIETSMPVIEHGAHQLVVMQPDLPLLLDADPTRIAQVLSNLLNNAAKYTPLGGRIEVTVRRDGGDVTVSVADNGVGIPAESLSSIFLMFNQVRHNLHRAQGGLGVGLSLVRRLVDMHGGAVDAVSAGPGGGSTFTVRLPLAPEECNAPAQQAAVAVAPRRQLRLLVADDNVDAAQSLAAMFELQGHVTQVAHSGMQAIKLARDFLPEVAFLDIGMPELNGYETARAMRALAGMESVVLVALTGWGNESDRALSKEAGFDHHLTKPADGVTIDRLLGEIALGIVA